MTLSRITIAAGGPTFSRIAQGFGSAMQWKKGPQEVLEHISECVDLGVTTLDTAAAYGGGQAEILLGDALALNPALRERVQIITKCSIGTWDTSLYHYDTSNKHILGSVEKSLRQLKTDHIDALLIHRPDPLMDADEVADAYTTLRQSGKVLHFGVSNFTPSQFELLASRLSFPLVTNEVQFSVMYLDTWYDGTLDLCQKQRISSLVWGPLGGGKLFTDNAERVVRLRKVLEEIGATRNATLDQVALAWLLKHPAQVVPILGAGKLAWIRNAIKAESVTLSREQWFQIWVASTGEQLP